MRQTTTHTQPLLHSLLPMSKPDEDKPMPDVDSPMALLESENN